MTIRKKGSKHSETALPDGGYVPVTGLNYGLDGYDFDMDYGDGVEDGAALPEAYGLSELPEGILPEESPAEEHEGGASGVIHVNAPLGDMMRNPWGMMNMADDHSFVGPADVDKGASLADLDWLDPTLEQDPDRLPHNPEADEDKGVAELEEAWGIARRTDGVGLVPNRDRAVAEYEKTLEEPVSSGVPGAGVMASARRLMRRQAFGRDIRADLKLLYASSPALAKAIAEDHGLAGHVFIRASAFPGMINGRWDARIRRHCSGAAFIVAEPGTKLSALDRYLGKQVVVTVPWREAAEHYGPRLKASGWKCRKSSAKSDLRRAFSEGPRRQAKPGGRIASLDSGPRVPMVSREQALAELMSSSSSRDVILGPNIEAALSKVEAAEAAALGRLAQRVVSRKYEGSETDLRVAEGRPRRRRSPDAAEGVIRGSRAEKAVADIRELVARGILPAEAAEVIVAKGGTADEMMRAAATAVSTRKGEYAGPKFTRATAPKKANNRSADDQRILEASKASGIKASEFRGLIRWVRQAMSEGSAGSEFGQLLKARFSKRLRTAASPMIDELRGAHEGLAGQVYVDAGAYESAKGTEGCDKGAHKHRANAIPYVLRIAKCDSCVFCTGGGCQKYNKPLIAAPEDVVEDPALYQREALRQADASDAETTAALFAGGYDPSEFGLHNAGMDDIGFAESPEAEELGGFVFGGLLIEDGNG
jgi:hypothetical protein